jgi:hypothetical protein
VTKYERIHAASEVSYGSASDGKRQGASGVILRAGVIQPQVSLGYDQGAFHLSTIPISLRKPQDEFALVRVGNDDSKDKMDVGYRYYEWIAK